MKFIPNDESSRTSQKIEMEDFLCNQPKCFGIVAAKCTRVIAIGVGNAVEAELVQIATAPASTNVIMVTTFSELQAQVDTMVDRVRKLEALDYE